jgi:phosphatidylserine decarboxylase
VLFHVRYKGKDTITCNAAFAQGQEMGWFQHGSTVIMLAPAGFQLAPGLDNGTRIRMGEPLMQWSD